MDVTAPLRRRACGGACLEGVFVTGAELSVMKPGFLAGVSVDERLQTLLGGEPGRRCQAISEASGRVGEFLAPSVAPGPPLAGSRLADRPITRAAAAGWPRSPPTGAR